MLKTPTKPVKSELQIKNQCLLCGIELPELDIACVLINKFERGHVIMVCPSCNGGKLAITVSINGIPKERAEKPWPIDWSKITMAEHPNNQTPTPEEPENCDFQEDPFYTEVLEDDADIQI